MKKVMNNNRFITFTGSVWLQVGTAYRKPLTNKIPKNSGEKVLSVGKCQFNLINMSRFISLTIM